MSTSATAVTVFRLVFNVPESHVAACKAAIFAAGAGRYPKGTYTECCWTTMGTGQFRPGDAANPTIGAVGELEYVPEVRVEAPCVGREVAKKAVEALKRYVCVLFTCYQNVSSRYRMHRVSADDSQLIASSAHPYEEPSYQVYKVEDF